MKRLTVTAGLALAAISSFGAYATTLDLTSEGAIGSINGAYFQQVGPQPTGTGYIDSFVEINSNMDVTNAYNTTINDVFDNGSTDQFNHELLLSEVPLVSLNGGLYYQFLLDINQTGADPNLSLDEIQLFVSDTPNQDVDAFTGGILDLADASLVYRLDAGGDNWIWLDYSLNSGSGSGDMFMYVPFDLLTGGDYVYLYSRFGENYADNDGFEEWAVVAEENVIPEPATVVLMMMGMAGILYSRKKPKA